MISKNLSRNIRQRVCNTSRNYSLSSSFPVRNLVYACVPVSKPPIPAAVKFTRTGSRKKGSKRGRQARHRKHRSSDPVSDCPWETAWATGGCLNNLTPPCKKDRQNLQELRAAMRVASRTLKPAPISTCLHKLSLLGCYDARLYALLTAWLGRATVLWPHLCTPRLVSRALLSCAVSCTFDSGVDSVAAWVGRQQQLQHWRAQHLSNALFAWAVLTATTEQGSTPSMDACAQRLFVEVNSRGVDGFSVQNDLGKLYWAHLEAQRACLPCGGLAPGSALLAAAHAEAYRVQCEVGEELRGVVVEVAGTLRGQGYAVRAAHPIPMPPGLLARDCEGGAAGDAVPAHMGNEGGTPEASGEGREGSGRGRAWGLACNGGRAEGMDVMDMGGMSCREGRDRGGEQDVEGLQQGVNTSRAAGGTGKGAVSFGTKIRPLGRPLGPSSSSSSSSSCRSIEEPQKSIVGTSSSRSSTSCCSTHTSSDSNITLPMGGGGGDNGDSSKTSVSLGSSALLITPAPDSFCSKGTGCLPPHPPLRDSATAPLTTTTIVMFARPLDFARHPEGRLRGKAALRMSHAARSVGAVVVVRTDEWEQLGGDVDKQRAYLEAHM